MRIVKIILKILLSLVIVVILSWFVLNYLIWRKPEIQSLIPEEPLAYIAAKDLDETLSEAKNSEFIKRVVSSPYWKQLKSSSLGTLLKHQWHTWQRQMMVSIKPKGLLDLVDKDAVLAFYRREGHLDFLLITEVSSITRINTKTGQTENMLDEVYDFVKEKYKGIELIKLSAPQLSLSYGFIGKAGLLSTDISLLRKVVDVHRGDEKGLADMSEFSHMILDIPESDVSLYANVPKVQDVADLSFISYWIARTKAESTLNSLETFIKHIDSWIIAGSGQNGDLEINIRANHTSEMKSNEDTASIDLFDDELPVPDDCLIFAVHETLETHDLFEMIKGTTGTNLDVIRDKLAPVLHDGAAIAILKPNIKEFQLLPPAIILLQVREKSKAQAALAELSSSLRLGERELKFDNKEYEGNTINCARIPIGMGMSLDVGYAFIGNDMLVLATDTSALEATINVSLGKQPALMENSSYNDISSSLTNLEGHVFVDIIATADIIKQAGRLYVFRAKLAGEREAAEMATLLYQNIFTLEAWQHLGAAFGSENDRMELQLLLNGDSSNEKVEK